MGNIGDQITETIPAVGTAGTTYATQLVDFLTEVKTRLESTIPKDSLEDGPLDMGNNALVDVSTMRFYDQGSALTTPESALFQYAGDLYWVSAEGTVQLTDGGTLNSSSLAGITGDYGGVNPSQFRFVDADQEYYAYDDFSNGQYARVWMKALDLSSANTGTARVRLVATGAASYQLTLPADVPATQKTLQVDATGAIIASNDLIGDVTTTGTITATGAIASSSTVTGTELKHTSALVEIIPGSMAVDVLNSHARAVGSSGAMIGWELGNNVDPLTYPVPVKVGDKITGFTLYLHKDSNAAVTITAALYRYRATLDSETLIGSNTNNLDAPGPTTIAVTSLTETAGNGYQYYVKVSSTGSASSERIESLQVSYTRT